MAVELTLVVRFEGPYYPDKEAVEYELDCIVVEYLVEEEV